MLLSTIKFISGFPTVRNHYATCDSFSCCKAVINRSYIAGYVTRHDAAPTEDDLLDVTTFYYKDFGGFTSSLDRGNLNVPTDKADKAYILHDSFQLCEKQYL